MPLVRREGRILAHAVGDDRPLRQGSSGGTAETPGGMTVADANWIGASARASDLEEP